MNLSTKAKNLIFLKKLNLVNSKIPIFLKYTVEELKLSQNTIIKNIQSNLSEKIIIRSSFFLEDSKKFSMAGEFEGSSNIKNNKKNIKNAIKKILVQYKKKSKKKSHYFQSEIIFQNYISKSIFSGVLTNFCIKDGSSYFVVNYDDISGSTDTVTSGSKIGERVINIFRDETKHIRSDNIKKIIKAAKEIEKKIGVFPIDLEFCIDKKKQVYILQIRPLTTIKNWKKFSKNEIKKILNKNRKKFLKINNINSKYGKYSVFGLMPDWNPAEMIGNQPSKLTYSIYSKLITKNSWSKAREKMGYAKIKEPLMYEFTGKPYIDTRLSFASLIPKKINRKLNLKLVEHWSKILISKPYLHDKIEFEIVDGSYDFNTIKNIYRNYNFLSKEEKNRYLSSLKEITENQINYFQEKFHNLNKKLIKLENSRSSLIKKFRKNKKNFLIDLKKFMNLIKSNGIVPFAQYARNAFIAKKLLNSFLDNKIIDKKKYNKILNSLETITTTYLKYSKLKNKKEKSEFLNLFYHLRPGTYDINIRRQNKKILPREIGNLDLILNFNNKVNHLLTSKEIKKMNSFLKKNQLSINYDQMINYITSSIKLRENSKFIFTRSISDILEIIKFYAKEKNIKLNDLNNYKIDQILNSFPSKQIIKKNQYVSNLKHREEICKLPYLITTKSDFYIASILISKANFITDKKIESLLFVLRKNQKTSKIKNKIIVIENADPGYDWIFNHKIKGLITKYGGVNSHMSIRCHELNIPAAIGVGDETFDKIIEKNKLILNCKENKIYLD